MDARQGPGVTLCKEGAGDGFRPIRPPGLGADVTQTPADVRFPSAASSRGDAP
jgi:hypothetical protein